MELLELHGVVKSVSCKGQGAGNCSGKGKEGGDREMAGTRRGCSLIPIARVFNLLPSCLNCRSWLWTIIIMWP